jgi:hypothetical protein
MLQRVRADQAAVYQRVPAAEESRNVVQHLPNNEFLAEYFDCTASSTFFDAAASSAKHPDGIARSAAASPANPATNAT